MGKSHIHSVGSVHFLKTLISVIIAKPGFSLGRIHQKENSAYQERGFLGCQESVCQELKPLPLPFEFLIDREFGQENRWDRFGLWVACRQNPLHTLGRIPRFLDLGLQKGEISHHQVLFHPNEGFRAAKIMIFKRLSIEPSI